MEICIKDKDIEMLIELLYLGNWIINSNLTPEKTIIKYEKLYKKIFKLVKDEIEFGYEDLYDRMSKFIEKYNTDIFPIEFARQYADLKKPIAVSKDKIVESFGQNREYRKKIEMEIKLNGLMNIEILNK